MDNLKYVPEQTTVAVLMGGWSSERKVSLVSGAACAKALKAKGYTVAEVDVDRDIVETLKRIKPDVALNALHGPWGEDGCVQAILETLQVPYTHSGVLASALAMDKQRSKYVFEKQGIPVADSIVVSREEASKAHLMEPPYVIKPVNEGSSVGVFVIRPGDNRPPGELGSESWQLGEVVMIEKYVEGRELTVGVLGDEALAVTEIIPKSKFYDYESKYTAGGSEHPLPANLPEKITEAAKLYALKAHQSLGCRGISRADFRYDDRKVDGAGLRLLEINTQPGMTPTSLFPEQADYVGRSFEDLMQWMVEDASCQR